MARRKARHVHLPPKIQASVPYFLKLPREVRDEIYGHLLVLDRFKMFQDNGNWNHLDIAILYVNKQINAEATQTLRYRNCWVRISIEKCLVGHILKNNHWKADSPDYTFLQNLTCVGPACFAAAREFAIGMTICSRAPREKAPIRFIFPAFALSKFWRWFPHCPDYPERAEIGKIGLAICMPRQSIKLSDFLTSIMEFRGFWVVEFYGEMTLPDENAIKEWMGGLVLRRSHLGEILSMYRDQCIQQEELGRFYSVAVMATEAMHCLVSWIGDEEHDSRLGHLDDNGPDVVELQQCYGLFAFKHLEMRGKLGY